MDKKIEQAIRDEFNVMMQKPEQARIAQDIIRSLPTLSRLVLRP